MRKSETCHNNNNSDNPLASRRIDGGKKYCKIFFINIKYGLKKSLHQ